MSFVSTETLWKNKAPFSRICKNISADGTRNVMGGDLSYFVSVCDVCLSLFGNSLNNSKQIAVKEFWNYIAPYFYLPEKYCFHFLCILG